ncbi:thiamine-phosphate kinase [Pseudogracilibacillus sp. SO30301A]|uniref:thiamine-phosphate kinase n=1 Tax=Pseudogracilibacillus sp. SO30301A TaxID=3098291 RepID=UPI00300E2D5C
MDEFQFIDSIKQNSYNQSSIIKGIGDDAAVFRVTNSDIVTAVDTFVEGVHFTKQTMEPFHIGYRALAANISDIAAMGADPKFYLVSIVVPKQTTKNDLAQIYNGMKTISNEFKMDLIGGDTVSGNELTITITIIGQVPLGKARYRSDAKHNDIVFVTGTLGDSQVGLHLLSNDLHLDRPEYEKYIQCHRMPSPRVNFSKSLQSIERISLNDVSDGIANELREIAYNSKVSITIDDDKIPTSPNFDHFSMTKQFEWKYFGGEDFELVGTVPPRDWAKVQEAALKTDVLVTKIGTVHFNTNSIGQVFVKKGKQIQTLEKHGYIHKVGE